MERDFFFDRSLSASYSSNGLRQFILKEISFFIADNLFVYLCCAKFVEELKRM